MRKLFENCLGFGPSKYNNTFDVSNSKANTSNISAAPDGILDTLARNGMFNHLLPKNNTVGLTSRFGPVFSELSEEVLVPHSYSNLYNFNSKYYCDAQLEDNIL